MCGRCLHPRDGLLGSWSPPLPPPLSPRSPPPAPQVDRNLVQLFDRRRLALGVQKLVRDPPLVTWWVRARVGGWVRAWAGGRDAACAGVWMGMGMGGLASGSVEVIDLHHTALRSPSLTAAVPSLLLFPHCCRWRQGPARAGQVLHTHASGGRGA